MPKRLLDIGNCYADHSALTSLVADRFGAVVIWAHNWVEAEEQLAGQPCDLILVNRILDRDGSQGLQVIRNIVADDRFAHIPVMMVTNFDDHQKLAQEAGAEPGFGKRALHAAETLEKLSAHLG